MEYAAFFLFLSSLLTFIYALTIFGRRNSRLPPGPYPFPIIGNLLQVGNKPHHSLAILSKRYGPFMSLMLGSKTTIVISSPDMAKEFFHTNDQSFSGRFITEAIRSVDHHKFSLVWSPGGDQLRRLRRITKEYMFSVRCLDDSELRRREKVRELLDHVNQCSVEARAVNIGSTTFTTILNILSTFIFSLDSSQYDSVSSQEFKDNVWALMEYAGMVNLADFFPILKPFDPQGIVRRGSVHLKKLLTIFDKLIDQRIQTRLSSSSNDGISSTKNDVLDLLLNLKQKDESEFSQIGLGHLFLDLFVAGTHSTSSTVEWAMTELIRNPDKMATARSELVKLMQHDNRNIEERDIIQLPYLRSIIKETFRLHPPAPFLVPHEAIHDVEVRGFVVPKNAQILCNVWAMGRDPNIWPAPEMFMPERFLEDEINYKGQYFDLIPFGTGRRICPGLNIAHRMLHMTLGSLIHKFDWKLEGDMRAQDMDMEEKFGITLQKKVPLMAIPIKGCLRL
ncbi:geraniol 8-hydroxylase-like [Cynara cardunculus var. scolymus]|uniref:geraniol 8-hydroxylase-like n=1 Tax=Cynara cardunculus var. scolymus TaxID=59895 RepID=UPI000D624CD5|nr:geraniol 8-hydroxylase-like [Cynara cardunculus var. scolymus]